MQNKTLILGSAALAVGRVTPAIDEMAKAGASKLLGAGIPDLQARAAERTRQERIKVVSQLTEAQRHSYMVLCEMGRSHELALEAALKIDPEVTLDDLRNAARHRLAEKSPTLDEALAKREAKTARRAQRMG